MTNAINYIKKNNNINLSKTKQLCFILDRNQTIVAYCNILIKALKLLFPTHEIILICNKKHISNIPEFEYRKIIFFESVLETLTPDLTIFLTQEKKDIIEYSKIIKGKKYHVTTTKLVSNIPIIKQNTNTNPAMLYYTIIQWLGINQTTLFYPYDYKKLILKRAAKSKQKKIAWLTQTNKSTSDTFILNNIEYSINYYNTTTLTNKNPTLINYHAIITSNKNSAQYFASFGHSILGLNLNNNDIWGVPYLVSKQSILTPQLKKELHQLISEEHDQATAPPLLDKTFSNHETIIFIGDMSNYSTIFKNKNIQHYPSLSTQTFKPIKVQLKTNKTLLVIEKNTPFSLFKRIRHFYFKQCLKFHCLHKKSLIIITSSPFDYKLKLSEKEFN